MDISVFMTQQTAGSVKTGAAGTALSGAGGVSGFIPGMSFMDMIFARATAEDGTETAQGTPDHPLLAKLKAELIESRPDYEGHTEPLTVGQILQILTENDPAALEKIATPEEIAALKTELAKVPAATPPEVKNTEARQAFEKVLSALLAGLPEENSTIVFEITEEGALKISDENGENAPALIATGLTPEQLTRILKEIADGEEQGESFVIGLVKILPPEAKKEAVFIPRAVVTIHTQQPVAPEAGTGARLTPLTTGDDGPLPEESDFEGVLRILERAQSKAKPGGNEAVENAIKQIRQAHSAGLSTVQGTPPALSEIFASFAVESVFPEGWDFATGSVNSLNLTGPAQLTGFVAHVQQAGLPHPATQTVAAAIAKATTNGESKNITIQLEPPALGKVSVRMEFQNDSNVMKALIIAEKPETYLMLQRDAHVLERALQEAGLDTGGGLSFELSQDEGMFGHDRHGTGGHSGGGDAEAGEDETVEIIESRMDWYVDPQSGLMRYDALV